MQKIIVNKGLGEFRLSRKAVKRYCKLINTQCCKPVKDRRGAYWISRDRSGVLSAREMLAASREQRIASNRAMKQAILFDWAIPRDDPTLIGVVESLAWRASGDGADIQVASLGDKSWTTRH